MLRPAYPGAAGGLRQRACSSRSQRVLYHLSLPALPGLLFLLITATPVEVFGCRNRGLMAAGVVLASTLAALGTTIVGARLQLRRDPNAVWWLASTLLLIIPAVILLPIA